MKCTIHCEMKSLFRQIEISEFFIISFLRLKTFDKYLEGVSVKTIRFNEISKCSFIIIGNTFILDSCERILTLKLIYSFSFVFFTIGYFTEIDS